MTRIATLLTAVSLLAVSAQIAAAERHTDFVPTVSTVQVEVSASKVLSPKEMNRRGLNASESVTVTKLPQGPAAILQNAND